MSRRVILATAVVVTLIAGSSAWVLAADNDQSQACANITGGSATYTAPQVNKDATGTVTYSTTPGQLSFTETLAAPTCPNISYGLVVLSANPYPISGAQTAPSVLATAAFPGDGSSTTLKYTLPINSDTSQQAVCVYVYTTGGSAGSPTGKTGASFDGNSGMALLDRGPDWHTVSSSDPSGTYSNYCNVIKATGSPGQSYG
ncbi:MAG: hypothetical protein ABR579_06450 [Actinomycetota bacterium]